MGSKIKFPFTFSLLLIILLFYSSCSTTEPPDNLDPELKLELEDISCTEAWITITTNNLQLPTTITLKQNEETIETINLSTTDSLLYIDSLLPNQTYNFQAITHSTIQSFSQTELRSNKLSVTTMDTTSHNFAWQTWTFGEHSSSVLYDVAIIDENNIWAVGEIYMYDSLGRADPNAYNAVHWDGQKWELKRIYTYSACSAVDYAPLKSIWAFSDTNIVVTTGAGVWWFDGKIIKPDCSIRPLLTGAINKLWGKSSSDLYAVGNAGNIAHWNGSKWTKIESGTDLNLNDIWGDYNEKTGEWEILAVGTNDLPLRQGIFSIEKNSVIQIPTYPIQWSLYAVWFKSNQRYYVIGNGIYEKIFLNDAFWKDNGFNISHYATTGIRGNQLNDVFVSGAFGEFLHYNGVSWKSYINELGWFSGSYGGVALKNNLVVTVGYEGAQAKILLGKRIN